MAEIEADGKTVEEAIKEGLEQLKCTRDKVEIKILNEGNAGLFGLMGTKPARVRLTTKDAPGSAEAIKKAKEVTAELLRLMKFDVKDVQAESGDERVIAEIKSADSSLIIGKNGQTLEALEHVVNLILHKDEATRIKVTLDIENYRLRQEEKVQSLASKAAAQVKKTGKLFRMDPMPSKDRRLVHMFLKDDPDVETVSEGEGPFRKIIIKLKKK
jgi:spoIIIJ-associated protein